MKLQKIYLTLIFTLFSFFGFSQSYSLDSLQNLLKQDIADTTRVNTLTAAAWQLKYQDVDSSVFYLEQAIKLAEKIDFEKGKGVALRISATIHYITGEYDKSENELNQALKIAKKTNNKYEQGKNYNMLGNVYQHFNSPDTVLYFLEKALATFKEIDNKEEIAGVTSNLSNEYANLGNMTLAIELLYEALEIEQEIGNELGTARTYNTLAENFAKLGEPDKALDYYAKAMPLLEKLEVNRWISANYHNMSGIYRTQKNYDKAINSLYKAMEINRKMHDTLWISYNYGGIAETYIEMEEYDKASIYADSCKYLSDILGIENIAYYALKSDIYFFKKQYQKALEMEEKRLEIAIKDKDLGRIIASKKQHYLIFSKLKKYDKAIKSLEEYIEYKDSLEHITDLKKIGRMEATYNYKQIKQQEEFEQKQKDLQVQEEMKRQKIFNIFMVIGFILMLLLAIFMIIAFRTKQKANIALKDKNEKIQQQNEEIKQQQEEILAQNETLIEQKEEILRQNEILHQHKEEIEAQRDEITAQHQLVVHQKKEITDSIIYAKRIQFAALPTNMLINRMFENHFIFFRPRDIVSGDFYWAKEIIRDSRHYKIIAAADCTGHGVPGAFVSMLGISFLNELVRREEITDVAQLLDELRSQIKTALKQTGEANESKDGMDIAVAIIEGNSNMMQFSGANNPLYLFRKNDNELQVNTDNPKTVKIQEFENRKLYELKPNKQPIAVYVKEKPFTKHEVQLQEGDVFYTFSDGFIDQFGGEKGRKFMSKRFKNLLAEISQKNMAEQKEIINQTFKNWLGTKYDQLDDVLVVGIKI